MSAMTIEDKLAELRRLGCLTGDAIAVDGRRVPPALVPTD
jgi:hypothetical protein